jgi:hypothetical protein
MLEGMDKKTVSWRHHLTSPQAATALGVLAIAGIGVTIMAPQAFVVGALLCWSSTLITACLYYPELLGTAKKLYKREWAALRDRNYLWLPISIILVTAVLPLYFYYLRVPITTEVTLNFDEMLGKTPGVTIYNKGDIMATDAQYSAFFWNIDADLQPTILRVPNINCNYIKVRRWCGPLDMLINHCCPVK